MDHFTPYNIQHDLLEILLSVFLVPGNLYSSYQKGIRLLNKKPMDSIDHFRLAGIASTFYTAAKTLLRNLQVFMQEYRGDVWVAY